MSDHSPHAEEIKQIPNLNVACGTGERPKERRTQTQIMEAATEVLLNELHSRIKKLEDKKQVHELKTSMTYFSATLAGLMNFQIRENDRGFKLGDIVILREFVSGPAIGDEHYTGRVLAKRISHIIPSNVPNEFVFLPIQKGFIIFSIEDIESKEFVFKPLN